MTPELSEWKKLFVPPFDYDESSGFIHDGRGTDFVEVDLTRHDQLSPYSTSDLLFETTSAFGRKLAELITQWYNSTGY